jgi:hypothetical protein
LRIRVVLINSGGLVGDLISERRAVLLVGRAIQPNTDLARVTDLDLVRLLVVESSSRRKVSYGVLSSGSTDL